MDVTLQDWISGTDSGASDGPSQPKRRKKGIGVGIAIALMIAITVVLAGVLYMWTMSLAGTEGDVSLGPQEIPADPTTLEIDVTLDAEYVRFEGQMVPFYDLEYHAIFGYELESHPSVVRLPLPDDTVESLLVKVNGSVITLPEIVNDQVVIHFPANTRNEVEVSFEARGSGDYVHMLPPGRFIRKLDVQLTIEGVSDAGWDELLSGSLLPDSRDRDGDRVELGWSKQNAVLKRDIEVTLPVEEDPMEHLGLFYFLLALVVFGEILFLYWAARRLNLGWRSEYIAFLMAPFMAVSLMVTLSLLYLGPIFATASSMVLLTAMVFLVLKRFIGVKKGLLEMGAAMGMTFSILPAGMFLTSHIRVLTVSLLLLGLVVIFPLFLGRHRRKVLKKKVPSSLTRNMFENKNLKIKVEKLTDEKGELEMAVGELRDENALYREDAEKAKGLADMNAILATEANLLRTENANLRREVEHGTGRNFCQHCGRDVGEDFDYCPGCGKSLGGVVKCVNCNVLMSAPAEGVGWHCVNCGSRMGE